MIISRHSAATEVEDQARLRRTRCSSRRAKLLCSGGFTSVLRWIHHFSFQPSLRHFLHDWRLNLFTEAAEIAVRIS